MKSNAFFFYLCVFSPPGVRWLNNKLSLLLSEKVIENIQRSKEGQLYIFYGYPVLTKTSPAISIIYDKWMAKALRNTSCPWTQRDGRLIFTSFLLCWGRELRSSRGREEGWGARRFLFPLPSHCAGKENKSVVWLLSEGTLDDAAVAETTCEAALAAWKHRDRARFGWSTPTFIAFFSPRLDIRTGLRCHLGGISRRKPILIPGSGSWRSRRGFLQVCANGHNFVPTPRKPAGNKTH